MVEVNGTLGSLVKDATLVVGKRSRSRRLQYSHVVIILLGAELPGGWLVWVGLDCSLIGGCVGVNESAGSDVLQLVSDVVGQLDDFPLREYVRLGWTSKFWCAPSPADGAHRPCPCVDDDRQGAGVVHRQDRCRTRQREGPVNDLVSARLSGHEPTLRFLMR